MLTRRVGDGNETTGLHKAGSTSPDLRCRTEYIPVAVYRPMPGAPLSFNLNIFEVYDHPARRRLESILSLTRAVPRRVAARRSTRLDWLH